MNGSFEIIKDDLPVNWYYYAPQSVPYGDFDITSDATHFKEGKRSLSFQIKKCQNTGGRFSPGFFQGFKVLPNETYKVSFWIINQGCNFKVLLESGDKGKTLSETVLQTNDSFSDWKYFEFNFKTSPLVGNLRFEASILSAGNIWFDDIKIESMKDKSERTLFTKM